MTGITKSYPGLVPAVSTVLAGLPLVSSGDIKEASYFQTSTDNKTYYELCAFDNNHNLQGFVVMGKLEKVGNLKKTLLNSQLFND